MNERGECIMKKYKIGYTTGVFDLFHIGHLNILKKAKEYCDVLIVGVSTDELVEEYKHRKPIIPFEERFEIIKSIRYVDKAVPQTTMDKLMAWEQYGFEVMFHGDDWKNSLMYMEYERKFKEKNVELVYFPYTKNTSSTILTEALKHIYKEEN